MPEPGVMPELGPGPGVMRVPEGVVTRETAAMAEEAGSPPGPRTGIAGRRPG